MYNNVFFLFLSFLLLLCRFSLFFLVASFDGLRPLLVTCHCSLCSLANKLRSFVRSFVLAYPSSNLLNEVGSSFFRYFEVGLRVCDIVVKKFTFAILSPDEFLFKNPSSLHLHTQRLNETIVVPSYSLHLVNESKGEHYKIHALSHIQVSS